MNVKIENLLKKIVGNIYYEFDVFSEVKHNKTNIKVFRKRCKETIDKTFNEVYISGKND